MVKPAVYRAISGLGAYLPVLRLERAAAAKALRNLGLGSRAPGRRAVAGWDEDALTLAVEAARGPAAARAPSRLVFASTSAPFTERSQSALMVEALALPAACRTLDVAGSRRCAVSALLDALIAGQDTLIAAGEKRKTQPGSATHVSYGDGAASVSVSDNGPARLIGYASHAHDFLDMYASVDHPTPYGYEERFVRETATPKIIAPAIMAACESAGIEPGDIAHAAVHEPLSGMWRDIAKACRITAPNHAADLAVAAGDLGAAHALFALALALNAAKPGDKVLLVGFGSGVDALIFDVTDTVPGATEAAGMVGTGQSLDDYVRFLSLNGDLDLDWGPRSEFEQKAQATVIERYGRDMIGFIGGRDPTGNVQFPKSKIPIRPDADGAEALVDVRLADAPAKLASVTADRLNFTPDPPFWFGLVQFDNGARVLMELTDANAAGFKVGDAVTMRLRIKSRDRRRGMRTYFWKAAPVSRPALEG